MGWIEAIVGGLVALGSVVAAVLKYLSKAAEVREEKAKGEFKDKIIVAMKRRVQNQEILHAKLDKISKAKTMAELNALYSDVVRGKD